MFTGVHVCCDVGLWCAAQGKRRAALIEVRGVSEKQTFGSSSFLSRGETRIWEQFVALSIWEQFVALSTYLPHLSPARIAATVEVSV